MTVPYEPDLNQIATDFEKLMKSNHKPKAKILTDKNELVGWINDKNIAVIGIWTYVADGYTFERWCKLNKIHLEEV
jgi:hypothetical protein